MTTSSGSIKSQQQGEKLGCRIASSVEVTAAITSSAADAAGFISSSWITCALCIVLYLIATFAPLLFESANKQGLEVLPLQARKASNMMHSITEDERATIIAHVAECGKWEGTIGRVQVELRRHDAPMFWFAATFQRLTKTGWRITVDAAIDAAIEAASKLIDPETGIAPISLWGSICGRGFVSNAAFGPGQTVIPRTNRDVTRKWRALGDPS